MTTNAVGDSPTTATDPRMGGRRSDRVERGVVVIGRFVEEHVAQASMLYELRSLLVSGPRTTVEDLSRIDERLSAHLDGVSVAQEHGWAFSGMVLDPPSAGDLFTATAAAIKGDRLGDIGRLLAIAEVAPPTWCGLLAAFGWVESRTLRGKVADLLSAKEPLKRFVGVAACAMHRVEPGRLSSLINDQDPLVRSRALRMAGEVGSMDSARACANWERDEHPDRRFWASWSGVLLGNGRPALDALSATAMVDGPQQQRAIRLTLQAITPAQGHDVLQALAAAPANARHVISGSGIVGDPAYVPWLINRMSDHRSARLAAEAFSLITGADLARIDLERSTPNGIEDGPNDDPDDSNVDMDPDDGLPWPDRERIGEWWDDNKSRFHPGTRYFMGKPVTRENCVDVLRHGYQRQRILAAHYLCLLRPGTPLFNTSAPAWRQQRLLTEMK